MSRRTMMWPEWLYLLFCISWNQFVKVMWRRAALIALHWPNFIMRRYWLRRANCPGILIAIYVFFVQNFQGVVTVKW